MAATRVTLEELRTGGVRKLETKCVKAKVLSLTPFPEVGPSASRARVRCSMVLADASTAMRGFCYQSPNFQVGWTIKLRNYGVRDCRVLFHTRSVAIRCPGIEIPPAVAAFAEDIRVTPHSPVKTLKEVSATPKDTRVSFNATIAKVDSIRETKTKMGKVALRELTVTDETGQLYVTLWARAAERQFDQGQRLVVSDALAVYSEYHRQIAVSINFDDEVQTNDSPIVAVALMEGVMQTHDGNFMASFVIAGEDYEFSVTEAMVVAAMNLTQWDEDVVFERLPIDVSLSYINQTVLSLERLQADVAEQAVPAVGQPQDIADDQHQDMAEDDNLDSSDAEPAVDLELF